MRYQLVIDLVDAYMDAKKNDLDAVPVFPLPSDQLQLEKFLAQYEGDESATYKNDFANLDFSIYANVKGKFEKISSAVNDRLLETLLYNKPISKIG